MGKQRPHFVVRHSGIHGKGGFAVRTIRRGTRIVEYTGKRITNEEADELYGDSPHTFLFIIDDETVIDAGVGGNGARYINHSCEPNCESGLLDGRVFIWAIKTIQPGEELTYDYKLRHERWDDPEIRALYVCKCGTPQCRGTMLARRRRKRKK